MARQRDSTEATIEALDMNKVREHYLNRERCQMELRRFFEQEDVPAFARLALGISNDGRGLGVSGRRRLKRKQRED